MKDERETGRPEDAETITRLRGERPGVVRLSRRAIALGSAALMALVGGTLLFALQPVVPEVGEELISSGSANTSERFTSGPQDYSQIPQLGPPLPGDLGKPILDARERGAVAALPPVPGQSAPRPVDPRIAERERFEQERDVALSSGLFLGRGSPNGEGLGTPEPPAEYAAARSETDMSGRQADSVPVRGSGMGTSILMAGSIIPAALITGIRSDQPGLVTAQVLSDVHDSVSGRLVLVPQGSRLIGEYRADVGFGQRRIELAWKRLIMPGGRSIDLDDQPAVSRAGYTGLEDRVDNHWGGILRAALVSTLLGIGGELGSGGEGPLIRAIRRGGQDSIGRAGEQVVSRELGIRPTLSIRPGFPVNVLVTRDIDFRGVS